MKSSTIFLVAVAVFSTLFLEGSTAPASKTSVKGDFVVVDESVKEFVNNAIESSVNALIRVQQATTDAINDATGDQKEILIKIDDWLVSYLETVIGGLTEQILDSMESGSVADLKEVARQILEAVEETNEAIAEFNKNLADGEFKEVFNKEVGSLIIGNAKAVADILLKVASG